MKRPTFGASALTLLLLFALSACAGKSSQMQEQTAPSEFEDENAAADGIQRMHPYDFPDTLRTGAHTYICTIHREADESLPLVEDEEGTCYADNRYTLAIQCDGQTFFNRSFTKATFASYLSKEFLENGLLDGMMLDKSLPGLVFAVSVTLPQSDMVEPLLLHVDNGGGISIERDIRSENDFEEQ